MGPEHITFLILKLALTTFSKAIMLLFDVAFRSGILKVAKYLCFDDESVAQYNYQFTQCLSEVS